MISVYHNRHWDPDILSLREIVEAGTIGDLYSIECNMVGYGAPSQAWRSHKPISGGAMYDMGAHQFEKILQLVPQHNTRGERINKQASLYGNFLKRVWHNNTNEDFCRAYVRFDTGLEAQLINSSIHASSKPLWTVQGTNGSVVMAGWDGSATVTRACVDGRHQVVEVPKLDRGHNWQGYYKNVSDHLLSGLPLLITGEWAKGPIQCIEGCETAARENKLVEIEFDF
jgi:predicted dehydrogenase